MKTVFFRKTLTKPVDGTKDVYLFDMPVTLVSPAYLYTIIHQGDTVAECTPVGDLRYRLTHIQPLSDDDIAMVLCYHSHCLPAMIEMGHIPKERLHSIILRVLRENGYLLKYVPADWQNHELCITAVHCHGQALQYVADRNEKICQAAVFTCGTALKFVDQQTTAMCLIAVSQTGMLLRYVQKQTFEICFMAVTRDGLALDYVEERFKRIPELCMQAVQQNGLALEYVPEEIDRYEYIQRFAVQQNGMAIQFVHPQTFELCEDAYNQNPDALDFITNAEFRRRLVHRDL